MRKKKFTEIHKKITTNEFDEKFDKGEDLSEHLDWKNATKRIPFDLPIWAVKKIDQEAARRGMTRQSVIKNWVIDKVDELTEKQAV